MTGPAQEKYPRWHDCHHCQGHGCEVCEEEGGWMESAEERSERLALWQEWDKEEDQAGGKP